MALNFIAAGIHPKPSILLPRHKKHLFTSNICFASSDSRVSDQSDGGITEDQSPVSPAGSSPSARLQLDLLEQLSSNASTVAAGYESDGSSGRSRRTIRDQLEQLVGGRDEDFSVQLGKNLKKVSPKFLTISQKRNIKRQAYLDQVSQRNDSVFFATIGAFVILPPLLILGVAILSGYVQLFP
ncbi:hypothetical protein Nepgr_008932 [Nepenthes gracilis]|uniref:Uncharacterized protein n=1 Tax=Nepenthes gracilis TaxID=150966 RepID=A0AAD3XJP7_NEPGR|nr:hypothetical protein Nepgr_008932 [Nepenthes gracilis]